MIFPILQSVKILKSYELYPLKVKLPSFSLLLVLLLLLLFYYNSNPRICWQDFLMLWRMWFMHY